MLADSFYFLKSIADNGSAIDALIQLNPSHAIFEGHFPGQPVTPGVVQMELVKELMEKQTGTKLLLKNMSNAKFLAVLNPTETSDVNVSITYSTEDTINYKVSATIASPEKVFFKLQGNYLVK